MKPWDNWTWKFPDAGEHPAVVLSTEDRAKLKPRVSVVVCSTQQASRRAEIHEVILDEADGLERPTLCKCDLVYAAPKSHLVKQRGRVTSERRRAIAERVSVGLAWRVFARPFRPSQSGARRSPPPRTFRLASALRFGVQGRKFNGPPRKPHPAERAPCGMSEKTVPN